MSIPARRSLVAMLFLAVWLVPWSFGEASALDQITSPNGGPQRAFLLLWLVVWTLGGIFAAFGLLWSLVGREVLELRSDVLVHRYSVLGLGRTRVYDLASIKDLRVAPIGLRFENLTFSNLFDRKGLAPTQQRPGDFWGLRGGPIVFDYGARTVRCGAGLDEAEAKTLIDQLSRWNPRLRLAGAA